MITHECGEYCCSPAPFSSCSNHCCICSSPRTRERDHTVLLCLHLVSFPSKSHLRLLSISVVSTLCVLSLDMKFVHLSQHLFDAQSLLVHETVLNRQVGGCLCGSFLWFQWCAAWSGTQGCRCWSKNCVYFKPHPKVTNHVFGHMWLIGVGKQACVNGDFLMSGVCGARGSD